jgi:K+-transporting ATPase ATPase C chain
MNAPTPSPPSILALVRTSVAMLATLTLLTGVVYPLVVTAIGTAAFPSRVRGSLVTIDGQVRGSALIGQPFESPRYFWGRPSATSPGANDARASSGSNLGPTNPALTTAVKARIEALRLVDPDNAAPVPVDLVTTSGSGLDPDITPAAAAYQVRRVARERGLAESRVRELVEAHVEARTFGIFGEPRVNVLALNLALDREP